MWRKDLRPTSNSTDEELMFAYQDGEHKAFEILYERYKSRIYSFIRKRVANNTDANDIFQQVLMKLHQSRALYSHEYSFAPWIFTISRTTLIDFYRKQKTTQTSQLKAEYLELKDSMLEFEESQHLSVLLKNEELSPLQRSALRLKFFDEQTYDQMAKRLNVTQDNVRQAISRSIKKLKISLEKDKGGV
jgi:RNA polymerase sigma factor (sigma-70 family)